MLYRPSDAKLEDFVVSEGLQRRLNYNIELNAFEAENFRSPLAITSTTDRQFISRLSPSQLPEFRTLFHITQDSPWIAQLIIALYNQRRTISRTAIRIWRIQTHIYLTDILENIARRLEIRNWVHPLTQSSTAKARRAERRSRAKKYPHRHS